MSRPAEIARAWALSRVGHPYLYGGTGQPCTVAYRKARAAQYPASADKIRRNCPRMAGSASSCEGCRWYDPQEKIGKTAYDCAQLTRWCMNAAGISLVSGATSQWTKTAWAEKGALSQMPLDRLCLVYRQDSASVMGHAGIYLGDGTVVHAKGHAEGVVREQLNEGHRFTHYAIPQGLYGAAEEDTAAPADVPANVSVNAPATALTHLDAALDALTQARQALLALQAALREASHAAG